MKLVAKPIDAVVVFRGEQLPLPYKFRYSPQTGKSRDIVVEKIISAESTKIASCPIYVYECQSTIDGTERRYQLRFFLQECRWILHKI